MVKFTNRKRTIFLSGARCSTQLYERCVSVPHWELKIRCNCKMLEWIASSMPVMRSHACDSCWMLVRSFQFLFQFSPRYFSVIVVHCTSSSSFQGPHSPPILIVTDTRHCPQSLAIVRMNGRNLYHVCRVLFFFDCSLLIKKWKKSVENK